MISLEWLCAQEISFPSTTSLHFSSCALPPLASLLFSLPPCFPNACMLLREFQINTELEASAVCFSLKQWRIFRNVHFCEKKTTTTTTWNQTSDRICVLGEMVCECPLGNVIINLGWIPRLKTCVLCMQLLICPTSHIQKNKQKLAGHEVNPFWWWSRERGLMWRGQHQPLYLHDAVGSPVHQ